MSNPNTAEEIKTPKKWRNDDYNEKEKIKVAPFGLFDTGDMKGYAKYHTTQTLDRLKGRVKRLEFERDYNGVSEHFRRGNDECVDLVIQLIEEVSD